MRSGVVLISSGSVAEAPQPRHYYPVSHQVILVVDTCGDARCPPLVSAGGQWVPTKPTEQTETSVTAWRGYWRACIAAAAIGIAAGATPSARSQDFEAIAADDARLIIDPAAFGGNGIRRSVADDGFIRYELWATPFSTNRRFFHVLLREVLRGSPVANPADLREIVSQFLGGRTAAVVWQDAGDLRVGLGDATFQTFQLAGMGCAGFVVDYGFGPADRTPRAVEGLYCDPAVSRLPLADIERTLNGVGVTGVYEP